MFAAFNLNKCYKIFVVLIFIVSLGIRLNAFAQEGGDHLTYKQAVNEYLDGINPYEYTVKSYQDPDLNHGYAYMPTLLYIQAFLTKVNGWGDFNQPTIFWYKIPVLLADMGVGFMLYKILSKEGFSKTAVVGGLIFWFFNPYFFMRYEYTNYETLPVLFLLLSIVTLGKKDFLTGMLYALAVSLKTFPIIFFIIYLVKAKNVRQFLCGGTLVAVAIFLPFMKTENDFVLMLQGSLLVHGERGIQGRPLLSFITYYLQNYGINFYQAEFSKLFAIASIVGAQLVSLYLYYRNKAINLWVLMLGSFLVYTLLTPVFNRTHSIWLVPFIYLGISHLLRSRVAIRFAVLTSIYIAMCVYYYLWYKGFKNPEAFGSGIWVGSSEYVDRRFAMLSEFYIKAVKMKKQFFD